MVYGNFKKDNVDERLFGEPIDIYGSLKYSGANCKSIWKCF